MSRSLATESLLARNRVPVRFRFGCSASGSGGSFHNCVSVPRREYSEMYQTRHSQRAVVSCEQLLMSCDSDTVPSRGPAPVYEAQRVLWIGSGRFDGRIGDGNGPRACRGPNAGIDPSAWADGTVRQLAWGTRVVRPP